VAGTITASTFIGDGSGLTGITGFSQDLASVLSTSNDGGGADMNNLGTVTATAFAGDGSGLSGVFGFENDAYVIVQTTSNATTNGTNLLAAYAAASALTPNGSALSADNRAAVIVPPGNYDLGTGALTLDAEFVNLVGLSSDPRNQYIFGESDGSSTGVIMQTADDVAIENLRVECILASGTTSGNDTSPAAYFPDPDLPNTVIRNCVFEANDTNAFSMRLSIEYSGAYEDVEAGFGAFGGSRDFFAPGIASGTFINCSGGDASFAGGEGVFSTLPEASGTFINCSGGDYAFAGGAIDGGEVSGTFTECVGGVYAFGGGGNRGGTLDGTFLRCEGGAYAFGGGSGSSTGGTISGTLTDCSGGDHAFCGGLAVAGTINASATLTRCSGGDFAFVSTTGSGGSINGTFYHCSGGNFAFGGSGGTVSSGTFYFCEGGGGSFTGTGTSTHLFCIEDGAQFSGND
jgi:hypothetical protein